MDHCQCNKPSNKMSTGEVVGLSCTVDYAAGSIVSKEVIKRAAGTITLFAFDQGQGLSEHSAPFDAFVQILDGSAKVTIGGQAHTVEAGQALIMPADIPHALQAERRFKMLLVMIKEK